MFDTNVDGKANRGLKDHSIPLFNLFFMQSIIYIIVCHSDDDKESLLKTFLYLNFYFPLILVVQPPQEKIIS